VAISNHTRKILWSLSGNACARCGTSLVRAPDAVGDVHAIVGRECHIVAQAAGGPRGAAGSRDDLDGPGNLILLCANCHAVVDMQFDQFPPDELRRLKAEHEQAVARRNAPCMPDIRLCGRDAPISLRLVSSGDDLVDILGPSLSCIYDRPDPLSPAQRKLLGDFFESCQDWGDVHKGDGVEGRADQVADLTLGQHLLPIQRDQQGQPQLRRQLPPPAAAVKPTDAHQRAHRDDAFAMPQRDRQAPTLDLNGQAALRPSTSSAASDSVNRSSSVIAAHPPQAPPSV
jgi:hypothetical protein